jgi:tRNA-Thr(GGU) m(6)t(6)A37 methyltransferase TsaA
MPHCIFIKTVIMDNPYIQPIGIVHSSLKNLKDCPLQEAEGAPEAVLEIYPAYLEGLDGLGPGSELVLLTWFHEANRSVVKCYPRNHVDAPYIGVFGTRSPDRPNPIGLHYVRITEMDENGKIKVFPLEALDGTPLVDIKPVINNLR